MNYKKLRSDLINKLNLVFDGIDLCGSVYVWPTKYCGVGCSHCNFSSVKKDPSDEKAELINTIPGRERVKDFAKDSCVEKFVISGGGEPMYEIETVKYFIREIDSPRLREIEIITSGFWAKNYKYGNCVLNQLLQEFNKRENKSVELTIRISYDQFHAEKLGVMHVLNILNLIRKYEMFNLYFRSVLIKTDNSFHKIADILDAKLTKIEDYKRHLILKDGRKYLIYYKNLIFDGRMRKNRTIFDKNDYVKADKFKKRFLKVFPKHLPARVYTGPNPYYMDGLALIIESDCSLKILEGNSPDYVQSLIKDKWSSLIRKYYMDPITIFLTTQGLDEFIKLAMQINPVLCKKILKYNQLYYLVDKILEDEKVNYLMTLKCLVYLHNKRIIKVGSSKKKVYNKTL